MIRLLISILCALGLAFAPMTASAAAAPRFGASSCTMDGKMPIKPDDHARMDCCTPACQLTSAAALLPQRDGAPPRLVATGQRLTSASVAALESIAPSALDPPPRA